MLEDLRDEGGPLYEDAPSGAEEDLDGAVGAQRSFEILAVDVCLVDVLDERDQCNVKRYRWDVLGKAPWWDKPSVCKVTECNKCCGEKKQA